MNIGAISSSAQGMGAFQSISSSQSQKRDQSHLEKEECSNARFARLGPKRDAAGCLPGVLERDAAGCLPGGALERNGAGCLPGFTERDAAGCIPGIDPPLDQGKKSFCYAFAFGGGCNWPQCNFNHYTQVELSAIPCKFYAADGSCKYLEQCVYKHE